MTNLFFATYGELVFLTMANLGMHMENARFRTLDCSKHTDRIGKHLVVIWPSITIPIRARYQNHARNDGPPETSTTNVNHCSHRRANSFCMWLLESVIYNFYESSRGVLATWQELWMQFRCLYRDTIRRVDQHSFQQAPSWVPHGKFAHHSIPGPVGRLLEWHLRVTENIVNG